MKLFRKFRQELLRNNKYTKYILYGIGEILLVVIGILIAVNINNINEARKIDKIEIQTLKEIQTSLRKNLDEINRMSQAHQEQIDIFETLMLHLDSDAPYHDSLDLYLGRFYNFYTPLFDYAPYETLKLRGVELIKNDSVKNKIINVYEKVIYRIVEGLGKFEDDNNASIVMPYFAKNFEIYNAIPSKVRPNNYELLRKDKEYNNILSILKTVRTFGLFLCAKSKTQIENTLDSISKEVEYNR